MNAEVVQLADAAGGFDWNIVITVIAIAVLLFLSGFFSGSETALTATSRARIHHLVNKGNKRAKQVEGLIDDSERLIGAILLGNNLVNILASALATSLFLSLFGDAGVAYATLVMTALVVIFAEVMPKSYAIANPERTGLAVAPIIRAVVAVFAPVVSVIQWLVRLTMRLLGQDLDGESVGPTAMEELRGAIDLHHKEGNVKKGYRDMLGSILELREVAIEEVMVHRKAIYMIDVGDPPRAIVQQVLESNFTRIPLYENDQDNIVGVLHAKDVLRVAAEPWGENDDEAMRVRLREVTSEPWYVPETTNLHAQLEAFRARKAHFALVVDEYGGLCGLVTLEDILEEIVGEIEDEHDAVVHGVRPQANGSYHIDGDVTLRDLNREFDWRLPDEEAVTLAGLVIHEAQTIPEVGQAFNFYSFKFEVLRRRRNQITALRVTPPRHLRAGKPAVPQG